MCNRSTPSLGFQDDFLIHLPVHWPFLSVLFWFLLICPTQSSYFSFTLCSLAQLVIQLLTVHKPIPPAPIRSGSQYVNCNLVLQIKCVYYTQTNTNT